MITPVADEETKGQRNTQALPKAAQPGFKHSIAFSLLRYTLKIKVILMTLPYFSLLRKAM